MYNENDAVNGFKAAMLDNGITPPDTLIGDSFLHRFFVEGDRKGTLNGAYILHLDNRPSGWTMHDKTGVSFTWTASGKKQPMNAAMRKQIEYAKEVRQLEQQKAHQMAAQKANWIWQQAEPITDPSHPYLVKKRINPHGARLYREALVIPIYDESGEIVNLQFIGADGTKRFLKSGRKQGCYSVLGEPTETLLLCEGWATGASLHESTGHYVVVAMDCGNLKPVAGVIRRLHPNGKIIVCADNDPIGVEKATVAAFACNGLYIAPPDEGQDFNDYINTGGVVYG
ncbi:toprim domain-containing protein [Methyloglobulus sp.]|uniref:toprim domain-containing protein n=1 Tax=Methyloglobulus sp. TaxID=2518622 RepID=UPI003989111A